MNKQQAIEFGKSRRGLFGGKMDEFIECSLNSLQKYEAIGYYECSNALLKMWIDNIFTDSQYYKAIEKLNKKYNVHDQG